MYATMNPTSYGTPSTFYYSALNPGSGISAYVGTPHVQSVTSNHTAPYGQRTTNQNATSATTPNGSGRGSKCNGDVSPTDPMSMSNSNGYATSTDRVSRTNLYIKGLTEDFTDQRLKDLVPDPNQVKSVKAATEDDNKCRGYGFIDFYSEEAAQTALRYIQQNCESFTIKFAKENEKDKTNLYVTNIPKTWTTKDSEKLKELFTKYGSIQSAFIMMERSSNKATGFVRFANEEDAQRALDGIKNNPQLLPGCTEPIETKFADKHNSETRRRRNVNQINGNVRTSITTANSLPLIQGTANFAPSIYNPYTASLYRPNTAAATSPFSSYQLAAYPGLTAQSLLSSSGYYQMPSVTAAQSTNASLQNATLQALAGHANGMRDQFSVSDGGSLSSNFGPQVFLTNNLTNQGLSASAAAVAAAYGHQGFDYAAATGNPYSYAALSAHHHGDH